MPESWNDQPPTPSQNLCARSLSCAGSSTCTTFLPIRSSFRPGKPASSGRLGAAEAAQGPEEEERGERDRGGEGGAGLRPVAGEEAAARLEHPGERVDDGDRVDPAL